MFTQSTSAQIHGLPWFSFFVEKAEKQCGTSEWSDCGAVLESTWASIYGIPTALLACAFFTGLSVVLLQAMRSKRSGAT